MSLLEIKKYPDKILKKKTAPVENIDAQTQQLIDDMIETIIRRWITAYNIQFILRKSIVAFAPIKLSFF
jgi:peptide deformylase